MKHFIIIKEHSERVANKNFLDLGGKPLYMHLLDELKGQEVFIDTDSMGKKQYFYPVIFPESVEIDYESDFEMAGSIYEK